MDAGPPPPPAVAAHSGDHAPTPNPTSCGCRQRGPRPPPQHHRLLLHTGETTGPTTAPQTRAHAVQLPVRSSSRAAAAAPAAALPTCTPNPRVAAAASVTHLHSPHTAHPRGAAAAAVTHVHSPHTAHPCGAAPAAALPTCTPHPRGAAAAAATHLHSPHTAHPHGAADRRAGGGEGGGRGGGSQEGRWAGWMAAGCRSAHHPPDHLSRSRLGWSPHQDLPHSACHHPALPGRKPHSSAHSPPPGQQAGWPAVQRRQGWLPPTPTHPPTHLRQHAHAVAGSQHRLSALRLHRQVNLTHQDKAHHRQSWGATRAKAGGNPTPEKEATSAPSYREGWELLGAVSGRQAGGPLPAYTHPPRRAALQSTARPQQCTVLDARCAGTAPLCSNWGGAPAWRLLTSS